MKNTVVVLDICSSKIVCIIARINAKNQSEILGIGYVKSDGIKAGIVSDVKLAQNSIKNAIITAEKMSGEKVSKVHICIASNYLVSQHIVNQISILGKEVTNREVNKLLIDVIQTFKNQKLEVIHTFACNYILDGHHRIVNPIGMFGSRLACDFHILAATTNSLLNLHTVISKNHLEIESYISSMYANGLACLTKDEMETGTILIDFGSDTTTIGIFENDQFVYTDAIPIGGKHITRDIAKILCISRIEAERIKNLHGAAVNNIVDLSEHIEVKIQGEHTTINRNNLIDIVNARIEEILDIIDDKIKNFKISNFVIVGGTSRLPGLKNLLEERFSVKVRIGYPKNAPQSQNNILELVTPLGVITHIIDSISDNQDTVFEDYSGIKKYFNWFKKTFF